MILSRPIAILAGICWSSLASAANIPGLFNTGVLDDGSAAAFGTVDLHYALVSSSDPAYPGPSAWVANPIASGYWVANTSTSQWIAPATNQAYPGSAPHPAGPYTYRLTFSLAGLDPATASISGAFAGDNSATIALNGVSTGSSAGSYAPLVGFTITTGFVAGTNTLDFIVTNIPSGGSNPTGLRVSGLAGTASVAATDTDGDGIADAADNCTLVANPTQLDANGDGYGNICDADLNDSNLVTSVDFNLMRSVLNAASGSGALAAAADMNGSGLVTSVDFTLLRARLNTAPGPSGLHP